MIPSLSSAATNFKVLSGCQHHSAKVGLVERESEPFTRNGSTSPKTLFWSKKNMSVIQLENDLSKVDERLRECFDKALGFEVQKELEAERKELSDKIFYEKNIGMQREVLELESEIESKLELAETHQRLMVGLAKEIDDKTIELLEMQKLHAGWSAQKYLAESNVQTLRTMIRELKRNRQIMVSERLASERYEARKDM
jgi:hypothetical protein